MQHTDIIIRHTYSLQMEIYIVALHGLPTTCVGSQTGSFSFYTHDNEHVMQFCISVCHSNHSECFFFWSGDLLMLLILKIVW